MKILIKFSFAAALLGATQVHAQSTGDKIRHDAHVVGNKTSEVASKGESAVVNKRYKGKYGPDGEKIYIDKYSHYYYVNRKGHHVYLKKAELRNHK